MGTRVLRVNTNFLLEFLKRGDDLPRTFTVSDPLPNDAKVKEMSLGFYRGDENGDVDLLISSAQWAEDSFEIINPSVTVHYPSKTGGN